MKILALGDITGTVTIRHLRENLWRQRRALGVDFVVANGENASDIHGISAGDALALLDCGVDLITTGNHVFRKRDIGELLEGSCSIIRPANYPAACPGTGSAVKRVGGWRLLCINVLGVVYLEPLACPFETVERILERERGKYDISLLDIHAEATSEKLALARYFDGRISIIFGTHTHIQTADEQILPGGTGYITDLGMSGPVGGILGTAVEPVIARFTTKMPQRFTLAGGEIEICGALFELDETDGRVVSVSRIRF
ncbi:MAG TPA: YmdB family metallophosphoesterase [Clostridiales bacterium]|jgi:metallophosphoesterase (TIGR00282 family)|nr:YmdB family metallophosphoesterase [Clostridiales bacterium]